jgi:tetratricopeptide (TPR) repeat protein
MPLISSQNYPGLILGMRALAVDNTNELFTNTEEANRPPNAEDGIKKMLSDAATAIVDFEHHRNLGSLDRGIELFQTAMRIIPADHAELPRILDALGSSLLLRFGQLGHVTDIDDAVERHQVAIALTPDDSAKKPSRLADLGTALLTRFQRLGNLEDLAQGIEQYQEAVNLAPDSKKPSYLNNLGIALHIRFERFGNIADIDESIKRKEEAVKLTPDSDPDKPSTLSNYGNSLHARFERSGSVADIDSAIFHHQMAVNLSPDSHPSMPAFLSNLIGALQARFNQLGNIADLDNAITYQQRAVNITPEGHPSKPSLLNNLGNPLQVRFQHLGNIEDIDRAIVHYRNAVKLTSDDHPSKLIRLANLGASLDARFVRTKDLADLNEAIEQMQLAASLAPDDHPNKPLYLNNLGCSLQIRFKYYGNTADIDKAVEQQQRAIGKLSYNHVNRPSWLFNLANTLMHRFDRFHRPHDADVAISHLRAAATSPVGPPTMRFKAAGRWIYVASVVNHQSLLSAYECALGLMPLVAWLGLPIADRHQHLIKIGGITRDAAAAAISFEQYEKALEWLEQGRSIVWTQILQLRTPVDQLRDVNPDLAERLLKVSRQLDRGHQQDALSARDQSNIEEKGRQYRALVAEWESIINQVRSLPDFKTFLRPPSSSRLKDAAQNGPVVVVNIAKSRCDALALLPRLDEVIHIPLPNISSEKVANLRDELNNQLYSNGIRMRGDRAARQVTDEPGDDSCGRVLAELWNDLVKPVLDSLAFSVCYIQI